MTLRNRGLLLMPVCGVVFAATLYAQTPRPNSPNAPVVTSQPASAKKKRPVRFDGEQMQYQETTQGKVYTADGNLRIMSEDMTLTTQKALWNETTGVATSPGKLTIQDPRNTLTGNTGTAFYKRKDAQIRGNVVINARPKEPEKPLPADSPRKDFNAPAVITCEAVDYNWGTKVAVATGNLKLVQKDRTVTADKATFETKTDRVVLEGNVVYTKSNGERGKATWVEIIITEGGEKFKAKNLKDVVFEVDEEDEQPGTIPPDAKPATPPTTPPMTPPTNPPTAPPTTPPPGEKPVTEPGKPDPVKPDPKEPESEKPSGAP
jgi:lipopolysaccharide assembly outer membrane protein LptD (OstA)